MEAADFHGFIKDLGLVDYYTFVCFGTLDATLAGVWNGIYYMDTLG